MGLARPALRFIIREHRRHPIVGPLLQLGRQSIALNEAEMTALVEEEGVKAPTARTAAVSPDVFFFKQLGIPEVHALDFSAYEGADLIHDLNQPVGKALAEKFNFILDGGTSEHVFDIRQTMQNIVRMLKPGGRILHMQPANNYVNHGFFQFSPTFYFDYYAANGFTDLRGYLFEHGAKKPFRGRLYELNPFIRQNQIASGHYHRSMMVFFHAQKGSHSTGDVIPTQTHYAALAGKTGPAATNYSEPGLQKKINRGLPRPVVRALQRGITALGLEAQNQSPYFDPTRHRGHPWGLNYLGPLD